MDYELLRIGDDGTEYRKYPNGVIRNQNGQIIDANGLGADTRITAENTRQYHQMRKEKILKAVENGLMRVVDAPNPAEAISRIVEKRAEVALTDNGRAGNDAAKIVLAVLDALPDKRNEVTQVQRHEYYIDDETMRVVERMMAIRKENIE